MAITVKDFQANVGNGLQTYTYTVPVQGVYGVNAFSTFFSPCGLITTINLNGSPIGNTPTIAVLTATECNVKEIINCSAGDIITIVISSSIANDPMAFSIKTIVDLRQGT